MLFFFFCYICLAASCDLARLIHNWNRKHDTRLISLNLLHPVDSGGDKSACQILGFYASKPHKVIQEYKSVLRNCHLPCCCLLTGRRGGFAKGGERGEEGKGGDLTTCGPMGSSSEVPDPQKAIRGRLSDLKKLWGAGRPQVPQRRSPQVPWASSAPSGLGAGSQPHVRERE